MGRIFYIIGKSASGKDKIFRYLQGREALGLRSVVLYTTRPIRQKEIDGREYHFVDDAALDRLKAEGRVIEERAYDTAYGVWRYATVDDGGIDVAKHSYLAIGTLISFRQLRAYFGEDRVVPVYIETEDGIRLERALRREKKQAEPKYREMCRRFLADSEDFSEENILAAGITKRFPNNGELSDCLKEVEDYISSML